MYLKVSIIDEKSLFAAAYCSRYEEMYEYEVHYRDKYDGSANEYMLYAILSIMYPDYKISVNVTRRKKTEGIKFIDIAGLADIIKGNYRDYLNSVKIFGEDVVKQDLKKSNVHIYDRRTIAKVTLHHSLLPRETGLCEITGWSYDINGCHLISSEEVFIENTVELWSAMQKTFTWILPRKGKHYEIAKICSNIFQAIDEDGDKTAFKVVLHYL